MSCIDVSPGYFVYIGLRLSGFLLKFKESATGSPETGWP